MFLKHNSKAYPFLLLFIVLLISISFSQKDTTAPKVSILSPKDGATVSKVVTLQVQATDNVKVTKVEFLIDNKKIGELTKAPFNFKWDTTKYADGKHIILIKAYDGAGNSAGVKITVNVSNKKVTEVPVKKISIITPSNEQRVTGLINIKVNIIEGKLLDKIEFYLNNSKIGEDKASPYEISFDTKSIPNAVYTVSVKSIYKGNASASSSIKIYVVNNKSIYGGEKWDEGVSVVPSLDGNFVIAAWTDSFSKDNADIYLTKLEEWEKTFGGENDDIATSMVRTKDGGYIITGLTSSFKVSYYDVYVLKVDKNGNKQWEKTYGGEGYDRGNSIKETKDGNYIIAGITESYGSGFEDIYVIKLNSKGDILWHKEYGTSGYDRAYDIIETSDGGYLMAGSVQNKNNNSEDGYILKLNSKGETQWVKSFEGKKNERFYSVVEAKTGGYIAVGETSSYGKGKSDVYLVKMDKNGKVLWEKNFGGDGRDEGQSVILANDGKSLMVVGMTEVSTGQYDGFCAKIDENGKLIWMKNYGGDGLDRINSICATPNRYTLVGATQSFGAKSCDVLVLKIDENGNIVN